jgi:hypothetical protein
VRAVDATDLQIDSCVPMREVADSAYLAVVPALLYGAAGAGGRFFPAAGGERRGPSGHRRCPVPLEWAGNQESGRCPRVVGVFASGHHARFPDPVTRGIHIPIPEDVVSRLAFTHSPRRRAETFYRCIVVAVAFATYAHHRQCLPLFPFKGVCQIRASSR